MEAEVSHARFGVLFIVLSRLPAHVPGAQRSAFFLTHPRFA